jgi:5-methylcytosine-specific restriction endonuclease McrA
MKKSSSKKSTEHMQRLWAWKKLRQFLKEKCIDVDMKELGSLKYCLDKYYELVGRNRPCKKSGKLLLIEYNNPASPIFKSIKVKGLTLKKETRTEKEQKYKSYIQSAKWRSFKKTIISHRGEKCEKCGSKPGSLDLHHKTYARLFNELPQDVMLLCRECHSNIHNKKAA